jgi:NAD+ diphosphatase
VSPFQLPAVPALSRSTVDRQEPARVDQARLAKLWATGRLVVVDRKGRTPVSPDLTELVTQPTTGDLPEDANLLGELDGIGYWSVLTTEELEEGVPGPERSWGMAGARSPDGQVWHDLRTSGSLLSDTSAGLFTTAVALANWHHRARFCANCGSPVERINAGWGTRCPNCGREEYPRTDPAVICLVHDGVGENGSSVLLARQPIWPPARYSVLAGFVEAGESLEACVAREIQEEVGIEVKDIRYLGSQPWPFPRSIMIGFAAVAVDPAAPLFPADGEIEEARWVTRDKVRAALVEEQDDLKLPGGTSIAYQMVKGWAEAD